VFTTEYSPQTNGQVERFNRTILNALRTYVAKSETDWDDYTAAITFGYNSRVHSSLGFAPFELVLSCPPPSLSVEKTIGNAAEVPEDEKRRFVQRLKDLVPLAKETLLEAQRRYKENFDRHTKVSNQGLYTESWVFLRRETANPEGSSKLDELADGPYRVVKSEGHTMVLRIGDDGVRVSKNRVTRSPKPLAEVPIAGDSPVADPTGNLTPPQGNDANPTSNNSPEFVIDKIVGLRKANDMKWSYKVRWYGYNPADDTWETAHHLPGNMLRRYHRLVGLPLEN
jgi:hypothetical protein